MIDHNQLICENGKGNISQYLADVVCEWSLVRAVGGPSAVDGHVAVDEVRGHVGQGQVRYHHLLLRIRMQAWQEIHLVCQNCHNARALRTKYQI